MPDGKTFAYSIVTPERIRAEGKAEFLALPGIDGEFGVLYNRAPLLVRLAPGLVRVRTEGRERWYFVAGGFAQVIDNQVTILTSRAATRADIQPADVEAAREKARHVSAPDAAGERKLLYANAEAHALSRLASTADV